VSFVCLFVHTKHYPRIFRWSFNTDLAQTFDDHDSCDTTRDWLRAIKTDCLDYKRRRTTLIDAIDAVMGKSMRQQTRGSHTTAYKPKHYNNGNHRVYMKNDWFSSKTRLKCKELKNKLLTDSSYFVEQKADVHTCLNIRQVKQSAMSLVWRHHPANQLKIYV
jgi:hypothetical protein